MRAAAPVTTSFTAMLRQTSFSATAASTRCTASPATIELFGGDGSDSLFGGAGKDYLVGGNGNDTYYFASTTDSGTTAATRDLIEDFENGFDQISLANIDANSATKGINDAFTYIGTNVTFTKTTGELRAYWTANGQIIEGDVNGDGRADFSIELFDPNHAIALDAGDFLL